jgi:hypothetical protein
MNRTLLALSCAAVITACSRPAAAPPVTSPVVNVAVAPAEAPLQEGDCEEARHRLLRDPDLTVDQVPQPVAMRPAPFQRAPARVYNRDGSAVIKAEVMIDTLGRAEMATFKPTEVSNPWFTANLKSVLPRWRFTPATLAGCKVRRVYRFSATVPPRAKRR